MRSGWRCEGLFHGVNDQQGPGFERYGGSIANRARLLLECVDAAGAEGYTDYPRWLAQAGGSDRPPP